MAQNKIPLVSVVIPVYNEEQILVQAVDALVTKLAELGHDFEIIIAENGSKDRTVELAHGLEVKYPNVRLLRSPLPDYGYALRLGILEARGKYVICDEIDLGIIEFYRDALKNLMADRADMVVGSKVLAESKDDRPAMRRVATRVINGMLRIGVGFRGTDTHGLKSFNRERILPVVHKCQLGKDLFASELVIRAERGGFRVMEIPLHLHEIRPPSIHLMRRVPRVLKDMGYLVYLIRFKG